MSAVRLALLLLLFCAAAAGPATAQKDEPPARPEDLKLPALRPYRPASPETFVLENRARGLVLTALERRFVDGRLLFRGGSANEPAELVGLAQLLAETLRSGGSAAASGREIDEWLDYVGATLSVLPGREQIELRFQCLPGDLPELLGHVGDLLRAPAYPQRELDLARARYLSSLERAADDSAALADRVLLAGIFGADSPFAREPHAETLARVTPEKLLAFHRAHLGPDRALLALTGPLSRPDAEALATLTFTDVPPAGELVAAPRPSFIQPSETRILLLDRPGISQTELRLAAPGARRRNRDYAALELWSWTVGVGGMTNRMMSRIRTELGLAYAVGAWHRAHWSRAGYVRGVCATRNHAVGRALEEMVAILRSGLEPIPDAELDAARERLLNSTVFEQDTHQEVLDRAVALAFHDYPADFWEAHNERLRKLTSEEVRAAAARYVAPDRLVVVAVGPAAQIEESLARIAPVTRVDDFGAPLVEARAADDLLAALGGAEAWRRLSALHWRERLSLPTADGGTQVVRVAQWRAFDEPWIRIEQEVPGNPPQTLVVRGEEAWSRVGERIVDLPDDRREALLQGSRRSLFRILRDLARGKLEAEPEEDGALVVREDGEVLARIELDADGRPARLTSGDGTDAYAYEAWRLPPESPVWMPTAVVNEAQGVRREVESVVPLEELDAALFRR